MICIPRSFVAEDADKALEALVGEDVAVPRQQAGDLRIERGVDRAVETNHRCQQRMQMKVEGVDSATEGGQEGNGSHNASIREADCLIGLHRKSDQVSGTGTGQPTLGVVLGIMREGEGAGQNNTNNTSISREQRRRKRGDRKERCAPRLPGRKIRDPHDGPCAP